MTLGCNVRFFIFVLMLCKVNLENNSLFLFKVGADKSNTAYEGIYIFHQGVESVIFSSGGVLGALFTPVPQCMSNIAG